MLKTHAVGILFAIFAGLCAVAPTVLAPLALGDAYRGVQFLYINDDNTYRARVQEILDGHYLGASTNIYEYKDVKGVIPPINDFVYALPAMLLGLSPTIILFRFLFPALLFLFAYCITYNLIKEAGGGPHAPTQRQKIWSAVLSGLLVTLGISLLSAPSLFSVLTGTADSMYLLLWTRLINPITGAIFLFAFLAILSYYVRVPKLRYAILAGIVLAPTVGYFFSFAVASCVLGSLVLIYLLKKDFLGAMKLSSILGIAIAIDIPYWYMAFGSMSGEVGRILAQRNGMIFTHEPVINKALLATTIFVIVSFVYAHVMKKWRDDKATWQYILALLLGSWGAFNHQIITGRQISFEHIHQYTVPVCFIVLMATSFVVWRRRLHTLWKLGMGLLLAYCLVLLVYSASSYRFNMDAFLELQKNAEIFTFLDAKASKDCVVLVREEDSKLEQLIPAYTACNVYSTTYLFNGISNERILHNFLVRLRLLEMEKEELREYLIAQERPVRNYFFTTWEQDFGVGLDPWFMGRVVMVEDEYAKFLEGDLKSQILEYRMDYLSSRVPLSEELYAQLPGLTFVGNFGEHFLYTFTKE